MPITAPDENEQTNERINPEQLLEARLWVARLGDGDVFRWWRTDSILGPDGTFAGPRVLPMTHATARARLAFVLARHACAEQYPALLAMHLFKLDAATEDELDTYLGERLADRDYWNDRMSEMERIDASCDPGSVLIDSGVVSAADVELIKLLPLGPGGRSVAIPQANTPAETIGLLAAAFTLSSPGRLVVPFLDQSQSG